MKMHPGFRGHWSGSGALANCDTPDLIAVMAAMKKQTTVQGVTARAPRPTRAAAVLLACVLSIPVFVVLSLIEWGLM
jgi:hypothetical protein